MLRLDRELLACVRVVFFLPPINYVITPFSNHITFTCPGSQPMCVCVFGVHRCLLHRCHHQTSTSFNDNRPKASEFQFVHADILDIYVILSSILSLPAFWVFEISFFDCTPFAFACGQHRFMSILPSMRHIVCLGSFHSICIINYWCQRESKDCVRNGNAAELRGGKSEMCSISSRSR